MVATLKPLIRRSRAILAVGPESTTGSRIAYVRALLGGGVGLWSLAGFVVAAPSAPRSPRPAARLSSRHHHCAIRTPSSHGRIAYHGGHRRHGAGAASPQSSSTPNRPRPLRAERERPAPSRLDHQGDDALSAVRGARKGPAASRFAPDDLRPRRRAGADEARPAAGRDDQRRGRDQGRRHQIGQRHGRRDRRGHRRQRGELSRHDDAQGACARHDAHASTPMPRACPTTSRSRRPPISPSSAAPSRSAFPAIIHYFSLQDVRLSRPAIRNHNHLLGRIEGMDGIKTGYTRASGFNLLTSVHRDGHAIVAVVLGGTLRGEPRPRDGRAHRPRDRRSLDAPQRADDRRSRTEERASAHEDEARSKSPSTKLACTSRFGSARRGAVHGAQDAPTAAPVGTAAPGLYRQRAGSLDRQPDRERPAASTASPRRLDRAAEASTTTPSTLHWVVGPAPVQPTRSRIARHQPTAQARRRNGIAVKPQPLPTPPTRCGARCAHRLDHPDRRERRRSQGRRHCSPAPRRASSALSTTRRPFTEKVQKGDATLYRARFAGLDANDARGRLPGSLKRSGFACFATNEELGERFYPVCAE